MDRDKVIQGVLLDLDGVLYIGDEPIRGAAESVERLRTEGLKLAGITNTTTSPRRAVHEKLERLGIDLAESEIFTPAALARERIGTASAALYIRDALREDFPGVAEDYEHPEFVVMGDIGGEGYPPESLREIFAHVMEGATILALHKNRFWQKPDGLHLDLGVFVAAIEYATGSTATVLGKPSPDFFASICKSLAIAPRSALIVGDDIESDIGGGMGAGLRTALVQTGKYREAFVKRSGIKADLVIPSIADLPDALQLLD